MLRLVFLRRRLCELDSIDWKMPAADKAATPSCLPMKSVWLECEKDSGITETCGHAEFIFGIATRL